MFASRPPYVNLMYLFGILWLTWMSSEEFIFYTDSEAFNFFGLYFLLILFQLQKKKYAEKSFEIGNIEAALVTHLPSPCFRASPLSHGREWNTANGNGLLCKPCPRVLSESWFLIIWPERSKENFYQHGIAWKFFALIVKSLEKS